MSRRAKVVRKLSNAALSCGDICVSCSGRSARRPSRAAAAALMLTAVATSRTRPAGDSLTSTSASSAPTVTGSA